jgi:hypothetical protein
VDCSWTVIQVSQFSPVAGLVQPCIYSLLGEYGTTQMQDHCPVQCATTTFCEDYAASDCTDAFTDCATVYAAMPTGDADASNDASEAGTQACVAAHLAMVDAADSVHCGHARGEGPCAALESKPDASGAIPVAPLVATMAAAAVAW